MWAEGFCNDVTIFSIISSSSAHIFRKLPTYLEKPHIRGCHQQLWSSPLSSLFRPLLTTLKCTDFGLISKRCNSLKQFFLKLLRHLLLHCFTSTWIWLLHVIPFPDMWAIFWKCGQKSYWWLRKWLHHFKTPLPTYPENCPHIWKSLLPPKKTPVLGGKKGPKLSQFFCMAPSHTIKVFFAKNWVQIDQL